MGEFGNRMKSYETKEKILSGIPFIARIDGKSFSKWTKRFKRPFDESLHNAFIEITKTLIYETSALIGYTQSDEITLVFGEANDYFGRKTQKLCSVLASIAAASMNKQNISEQLAFFDCRVFGVPTQSEATNAILWRELDCTKNAIQSAGHANFSHNQLHKLNCDQIQEKLWSEKQINFNDYCSEFKRGSFIQNQVYEKTPGVMRSRIIRLDMPKFATIENRINVIFDKSDPELIIQQVEKGTQ